MATKTRTVKTIVQDGGDEKESLPPLATWLEDLDDECKIEVHTRDEEGFWSLRCTRPPSVVTEDFLESLGAPATYKLKSVKPNGTWGPQRTIRIAGMPQVQVLPSHNNGGLDPVALHIINMGQKQSDRMHELILAMINARGNGAPSMTEMITAVTALKAATDAPTNGNGFEHFREAVEFVKEFGANGGDAKGDPWNTLLTVLQKGIPSNGAAPAVATAPAKLIPGNPPPAAATADNPPPAPAITPEVDARIKLLQLLKDKAAKGKDPGFWADYIFENQDDGACQALLGIVETYSWEQVWPGLTNSDPELANEPYKSWFERLYKRLREPDGTDDHSNPTK